MMNESDSVDLTRVGPGTVMGEFMRQYWVPCMMSSELAADGAPVRLPLLGEKLIAFRDTSGRVGIMDHRCPHRCASLFLGRNEQDGLRCVYHGWKYAADGACVDMPNVAEGEQLKSRIRAKAYRTHERAGLVWVYMGARETPPPLPDMEPNLVDEDDVRYAFVHRDCNWLQALEGDIDTSHFGFLHGGSLDPDVIGEDHPFYPTVVDRAPKYEVADTPWGTGYGAFRPLPNGRTYWRTANFLFPFWTQTPAFPFAKAVHARAWAPIDDHRTMFISASWRLMDPFLQRSVDLAALAQQGVGLRSNYLPNTTDWFGRWRLAENAANDWMIDREAQAAGRSFTGLADIHLQDQAVTESMGPITDHGFEHLTAGDAMVITTRRRLLQAARDFAASGKPPPGVDDPAIFLGARSGFFTSEPGARWQDVYRDQVERAVRPAKRLQPAE
jgi:phenylpropionate dioxygenase-like ring-hydroxylating dioxygenase large terminal subunit